MTPEAGELAFTRLEKVIFGPGRIERLREELERRRIERALLVTTRSLGRSALLDRVAGAAARRCAGIFAGTAQHAPSQTVRALTEELRRVDADAIVSFGGGSAIDSAKVAAACIMNGRDMIAEARGLTLSDAFGAPGGGRQLLHIAVPTTLSAAEMTPAGGVTDERTRVKHGVVDPRLQPQVVIYDPELTRDTPDWLWAATGMRALDHGIEAAYSARRQSFTDALAAKAIQLLVGHLKPGLQGEWDEARLAHRGHCQIGAWCSLYAGFNTGLGLSHAMGHQIGPMWNVPHGITSCITLPHAMRLMAGVAPERFEPIALALGIAFDSRHPAPGAQACAQRITEFIAQFEVPHSLREAGVPRAQMSRVAAAILEEIEQLGTVGRPLSRDEVVGLLEAAYERP
ncbi:MAG: iron-containing alcohol dehydrogenase [Steroidobacteraceae bacterium]